MAATVQSMCQYWKNFDLPELQRELDVTATDLAAKQDLSDSNRKKLVELSREFKKNTQEETRKLVAPLLKSFQGEIDFLSKRSKNAEAAFLAIYKKLIDVPDPVQALEQAHQYQKRSQRADDLELENKKLRETLDEYNNEFAEVKNQEVTIKNLREKLKEFEDKMENNAQLRAKEKEKELQRQFAEKERQLQETQMSVARKLGEAEHKVSTLQSALENVQSELFDLRAKYDEATSAKSDEMEMVMADLERANERAAASERQAEQLKQQLLAVTQNLQCSESGQKQQEMEQAIDILKRSSLEVELAAKEKEISQLVEDVQKLQASFNKLRESSSLQIARLEEELAHKTRAFVMLEEKLKSQTDYEEIRRELSILKSIEFTGSSSSDSHSLEAESKAKTLEVLLLEKNKTLQTDNTQLKASNTDLAGPSSKHLDETKVKAENETKATKDDGYSPAVSESTTEEDAQHRHQYQESPPVPREESIKVEKDSGVVKILADSPEESDASQNSPRLSSSASSLSSSVPPTPALPGNAEMFASILGQELAASYHFQAQNFIRLENGQVVPRIPVSLPMAIPNGFHPHPELMKRLQPNSPPMGQLGNGQVPPNTSIESAKLQRLPSDMLKSENGAVTAQVLDTAEVALRIREILSTHNIGQRLFAKHVLGLSQGTVSELLSKPKHWDKLTEKGRESYRKMYAWASVDTNVLSLKAISPKKGGQPIMTNSKQEDSATEERINAILSDAQAAMQARQNQERAQIANAMVASIYQHELAKISAGGNSKTAPSTLASSVIPQLPSSGIHDNGQFMEGGRGRRTQATDSGNLTQEIVAKIYQEELLKLALAAEKSGNYAESNMYRQELARLAERAQRGNRNRSQDTGDENCTESAKTDENKENFINNNSIPGETATVKQEPSSRPQSEQPSDIHSDDMPQDLRVNTNSVSDALHGDHRHAGSAFSLVRPRSTGPPETSSSGTSSSHTNTPSNQTPQKAILSGTPDGLSPLQQMQSIANSLMAKNAALHAHGSSRPLRAVLPPITQEQFDKYATVNTDELVKQVKETLSQYSISQRLFGENILGLSQGSVSDLLARPKPWHMLTQKGREPFIRMQIFLEDQEAIPKLVANQYKIAPDKLLRTNSMGDSKEQVPHARYNKLQEQYNEAFSTIQEQKRLITQLEEDLRSVNALSSMFRPDAEGEAGPPSQSAELLADAVKDVTPQQSVVMTPMNSAADSLLPIVQSQRERFRLRAQELEAQNTAQHQQVQMLQNEMDKLRSDNVKLYEKIKFLQSYPTKGTSSSTEIESRYSTQYEEKLDPFSSFNKKEKMRRYMNLKPYDKITLGMGKMVMGSKLARTVVFFYTIILHVLIFLVLYKLAYTTELDRDTALKCHHEFAEHMAKVHPGDDHGVLNRL